MEDFTDEDGKVACENCGDDCWGVDQCDRCFATLCPDCATMYEGMCDLCYTDEKEAD